MLDCAISYFLESVSHKLNFFLFPAYLLSYTFVTETHKPVLKKKTISLYTIGNEVV